MYDPTIPSRIASIYNTCSEIEKEYLLKILKEFSDYGESPTYETLWLEDYKEIPVTIDTFLDDPIYLGEVTNGGSSIYPYWRKAMHDIFDSGNKYHECAFTGATRIGKTSTAITCATYMLYRLMCLRDPQKFFGKKDVSKFSLMFFNLTKELASSVAYREFNDTLKESRWFYNHGSYSSSDRNFYYIPEGGKIVIDYGSDVAHSIGLQIYVGFMDEISFAKAGIKDINKAKANMKSLYDSVLARVEGTFRQNGEVWGKVFLVSSKKSDSDFMEDHLKNQMAAGNDHLIVFDKPQWEVLPDNTFSKERFYIAVGDRHRKGFVVDNDSKESLDELRGQGYQLLEVPLDMRTNFLADFDISLRDLAGITVPGAMSFITQDTIDECIDDTRTNPFYNDTLEIGIKDSYTIEEFFHLENIPNDIKRKDLFIHLDLSLNTDMSGISGSCISNRVVTTLQDGSKVSMPEFSHVFSVRVKAPRGDKIPYSKIVNFIVWLRHSGFHISCISRDQYQSEYLAQLLEEKGFETYKLSLDRTPEGYNALRTVMLEHRIKMLHVKSLEDELISLERDALSGKIDHKIGGSKDISDSFAGSIWLAILKGENSSIDKSNVLKSVVDINRRIDYKNQLPSMFPNIYRK